MKLENLAKKKIDFTIYHLFLTAMVHISVLFVKKVSCLSKGLVSKIKKGYQTFA
jgi:hypothetical protein